MGDLFAQRLLSQWEQSVKQGSQQVLVMHGAHDDSTSSFDWQVCDNMSVLGHQIQNNGSVLMDFNMTKIKLWRSFWRNAGTLQARRLPLRYRITLLKRATQPVADQHMLRWPYTKTRTKAVDLLQRRMLRMCSFMVPISMESTVDFATRRRRNAQMLQEDMGKWSLRWAHQTCKWHQHLQRDPNYSWAAQLLGVKSARELQQRRWQWSRPRTRNHPGFVCARWSEQLERAKAACSF
jgi:hypothetical protein